MFLDMHDPDFGIRSFPLYLMVFEFETRGQVSQFFDPQGLVGPGPFSSMIFLVDEKNAAKFWSHPICETK